MKSKNASKKVSSIPFYVKFSADFKFDVEKILGLIFGWFLIKILLHVFIFYWGRRHVAVAIQYGTPSGTRDHSC